MPTGTFKSFATVSRSPLTSGCLPERHHSRHALTWLREPGRGQLIRHGLRGVEKESLRVDADGTIVTSAASARARRGADASLLTTDYSESLPEFVTPPQRTQLGDAAVPLRPARVRAPAARRRAAVAGSMPCELAGRRRDPDRLLRPVESRACMKTVYRRGLGYRYGRRDAGDRGRALQLFVAGRVLAGLPSARRAAPSRSREFRSAELMGLVRNYRRCAWLVTYLFGASPALCTSFRARRSRAARSSSIAATWYAPFATSLRMSDLGYRNKTPRAPCRSRANSLAEYLAGIAARSRRSSRATRRSASSSTASIGSSTRTSCRSRTSTTARSVRSRAKRRIAGRSSRCARQASNTSRCARSI